jgi:glucose-1-phosphate adenylyltransferase
MYDEQNPIFTRPQNLPSPFIKQTHIRNSHICQGSLIEAKEITDSIIGVRCTIKKNSVLRGCVLLGNLFYTPPRHQNPPLPNEFLISENCRLEKVIIDEHAQIGKNVQLINKQKLQNYDGDGIFIRDGIIIVPTGTILPDHFSL